MNAIQELLKDNVKLPSPPAIAVRILDAVKKGDSSFGELARIISADPALTAKILKVSNSSFYALSFEVTSIEKALSVLGVEVLKNIALSFVIAKQLRGKGEGGFDFDFFWKRAITAAVAAELVAGLIRRKNDDTFVTGLLQDIGIAVMYFSRPALYLKVLEKKQAGSVATCEVEQGVFGFDHQQLGAELLRAWGLPETIHAPVACHHQCGEVPAALRVQADILLLADKISSVYHGSHSAGKIQQIKALLGDRYKIGGEQIEKLIDSVAEKSVEILSSFEIDPGDMRPFSQILQEANEELGKLNLSYEQLVMEYKQAKEKAERLAQEVMEANEKLREMAFKDGLTGLFNHRYFQELMDKELSRAVRYERPFSLVLFDIDHFKKINDTYGHPRGDIVLKTMGAMIGKFMRTADIAARYGGEEFAVVLPETDIKGARVMAERLRRGIEQNEVLAEGETIRVTVSIGITSFVPGMPIKGKAEMIDAADRALYQSKRQGRNRVSLEELPGAAA
ncbi:hypothetical protein DESUT3_04940 [Desulfuromonas versatilis]|uniref:diguanylate cyclase n=1 Tax=Desulfuromonas versatilis TaxID=2802975 RepID=A0ABN6DTF5_9BACT|nr:GGDEF domain-containing protein [Desulfuromonas versatilis]BCR03425.1 hypothetical protein DESUT3_04940 [Desulfuromonas versatilis]